MSTQSEEVAQVVTVSLSRESVICLNQAVVAGLTKTNAINFGVQTVAGMLRADASGEPGEVEFRIGHRLVTFRIERVRG